MKDVSDVRPTESRRIHYILFAATLLTTTAAGAVQQGLNPIREPASLVKGLPFSLTIMTILLVHEMGHYLTSRHHRVPATLPYFIPAPSLFGTFGAVIRMKGAIWNRRTLLDIGVSGPLAGFVVALPAMVIGFYLSEVVPVEAGEESLILGDSILVYLTGLVTKGIPAEGTAVVLHPVGFAGWIGMFVTSLNLLPVGQLDGGHITTALFPRRADTVATAVHVGLVVAGIWFWEGWLIWAILLIFLGIRHPPVLLPHIELDRKRRVLGAIAIIVFIITFVPTPFRIG